PFSFCLSIPIHYPDLAQIARTLGFPSPKMGEGKGSQAPLLPERATVHTPTPRPLETKPWLALRG
ncbi:MAG: hypothetical protein WCA35_15415, partial [Kovacikia sp.]